jgi:hypothetical protein
MILRESRPEYGIAVSAMSWIISRERMLASEERKEAMECKRHNARRRSA